MTTFKQIRHKAIAVSTAILLTFGMGLAPFSQGGLIANAVNGSATCTYSGNYSNSSYPLSMLNNEVLVTTQTNILTGKPVSLQGHDASGVTAKSTNGDTAKLNDGKAKSIGETDIYNNGNITTKYTDITFTLNGTATLQNFVIFNHSNPSLTTYKYALYSANVLADLDTVSPLISYTNSGNNQCQIFDISGVSDSKYFRIRVLSANQAFSDKDIRIWELCLYASSFTTESNVCTYTGALNGSNAPLSGVATDGSVTATGTNLLAGKTVAAQAYDKNGATTHIRKGSLI